MKGLRLAALLDLAALLLAAIMVQASSAYSCDITVFNQATVDACSTDNCTLSLDNALQNLTSNSTLNLEQGTHYIETFMLHRDLQNIAIVGQQDSEEGVFIKCASGVGLAFYNTTNLLIRNVEIDGCSLKGDNLTNTLVEFNSSIGFFYQYPNPQNVSTGLLLGHCYSVEIDHVTVTNVRGYGLLGINVIGSSRLSSVHFVSNGVIRGRCNISSISEPTTSITTLRRTLRNSSEKFGGGAVFLYQDFTRDYRSLYNDQRYSLDIDSSTFVDNVECSFVYRTYVEVGSSRYLDDLGYRIGGGGGLTLLLAQLGYGIGVSLTSTDFHANSALVGSAVHAVLFQGLRDTNLVFDNCTFLENGAQSDTYIGNSTSFGAAGIALFSDIGQPRRNRQNVSTVLNNRNVTVGAINSDFVGNKAQYGGAVYLYSAYQSLINDITDAVLLFFEGCNFDQNMAFLGPVMSMYEFKFSGMAVGIQIHITDTTFTNNVVKTAVFGGGVSVNQNFGVVDIRSINITLFGNCLFQDNGGTAIRAEETLIGIAGNVTFQRNTGVSGGAFYLLSHTFLVMGRNSSLYLLDNVAHVAGGALYVNEIGLNSFVSGGGLYEDCFLYFSYEDFIVCSNCSDLNSTGVYIKFSNNTAPSGGDVYGSALLSCPWALELLEERNESTSVFSILYEDFPEVFSFSEEPDGPDVVRSTAANLVIRNLEDLPNQISPGEELLFDIAAYDDFNQTVSTIVSSFAKGSNNAETRISDDNVGFLRNDNSTQLSFRVEGEENQTISVIMFSTDVGSRAQTTFSLEVVSCGFGFEYDPDESICMCNEELVSRDVSCDIASHTLVVEDDQWVGPIGEDGDIAVHQCIFQYCETGRRTINISGTFDNDSIEFDVQCAVEQNRSGLLCGECAEGTSAVFGTTKCLVCSDYYVILLVVYLLAGCLASCMIRYLGINITGGYINGIIFYSNIVSLYGQNLVPDTIFKTLFLVSIPTLNLGIEVCFYDGMTALERVFWQLSFPFYLFLLMGLTTLLARTRYLKFSDKFSGLSTIQMFATLLIVCYVSVLQACVELIGATTIRSVKGDAYLRWRTSPDVRYFRGGHAALAILAIILLVGYIIPLPIFLLFPSHLYGNRYLSKFKPIYDAFWHPFKREFRFWLGMRLIFRWVPFLLAFTVRTPINTFVTSLLLILLLVAELTLQPFEGKWRNIVNSCFVLNLIAIFSGSVFFYAESDFNQGSDRSTAEIAGQAYIQTLMVLGFFGFVAVCVYHVIIRFQKLNDFVVKTIKSCSRRKDKYSEDNPSAVNVYGSTAGTDQSEIDPESPQEPGNGEEENNVNAASKPRIFSAAVLREPLLASGFMEVDSVPSSSVPVRTSTPVPTQLQPVTETKDS